LVTSATVIRELGIPRTTLYRLVAANKLATYPMPGRPWHSRAVKGFLMSEVRAALGIPEPADPPATRTG